MEIVNVIGGLGNQMFQCAFALALSKSKKESVVKIDTSHFNNYGLHNGFEVTRVFPDFPIPVAGKSDIRKVTRYIPSYKWSRILRRVLPSKKTEFIQPYQNSYIYQPEVFLSKGDKYYEGYWMCPAYFDQFKDDIYNAYKFRNFDTVENKNYALLLAHDNSVTIHVRRGDYVGAESFKDICTLAYYRNAITAVKIEIENPVFFVFSNDTEWCKNNLGDIIGEEKVYFVSNNKGTESYRDMQLMSLARCNIVANSSFSWWGAYLNHRTDHFVLCPEKWVNNFEHNDHFVPELKKISII